VNWWQLPDPEQLNKDRRAKSEWSLATGKNRLPWKQGSNYSAGPDRAENLKVTLRDARRKCAE
jgi:hypothetical protein